VDIEEKETKLPFIPPNGDSFIFDPFSININRKEGKTIDPNSKNYHFENIIESIRVKSFSALFERDQKGEK
jgi:hypothetical protein